ncbi:MAG: UDP-N-acetylglucosamine 2-epimerase (non-hydrolyzing) [Actinomycetota bacterium]|nr:UDP-N-acetylglucosamine 2-epimerase (non-hydrolyzing) [Actinomycetota bacterium]
MNKKIKILVSFGTRPEGIKLAPVIKEIQKESDKFDLIICSTGQHKEMLKQVIDFFELKPDIELDVMVQNQSLGMLSSKILGSMEEVFKKACPDMVIVQGDTTTAFLTAFIAFYRKIKIGHVEAGLRTYNKYSPFPEEINRQLISKIADLHFAPTKNAYENLRKEGIDAKGLFLTGNTVVDAINWGANRIKTKSEDQKSQDIRYLENILDLNKKIILVTMHRRESFGKEIANVCEALKHISQKYKDVDIVYPVHLNPNVRNPVGKILSNIDNIKLIKPLSYEPFLWLMSKSYFLITDSGGVQEEAPTLRKPVLVIREFTERSESVDLGISKLIGTNTQSIINNASLLLDNEVDYEKMIADNNPYGDGKASKKIVSAIFDYYSLKNK